MVLIRMLKRRIVKYAIGGLVVVGMMATGRLVLTLKQAATSISETSVCEHLTGELELPLPNCATWLTESQRGFPGDYGAWRLECLLEAKASGELLACEDLASLTAWRESNP